MSNPDSSLKDIAFFLDRDGTINKDVGYLHQIEHFELIPGSARAIKLLNDQRFRVILVTNQSGIGVGLYTFDDLKKVNDEMTRQLALQGAHIDAFYASPPFILRAAANFNTQTIPIESLIPACSSEPSKSGISILAPPG
ncbi:MAG: hypothetical protein RLZZ438_399 [Acidobacteriota bacterium]|jgi:D-glycero-D-manno-heptose 1,7-bisphosphate phosphatase